MQRTEPPHVAPEAETLTGFLDYQRETLAWKCSGLTDEQLATPAVEPSSMSLLGLLRHLADVERGWFRRVIAGEDARARHWREDDRDAAFHEAASDTYEAAFAAWQEEIARSRKILAERALDDVVAHDGDRFTVRWIVVHMIEEYARHNGHADLLRERIDGATGE
ncbi:DinB family protein [Nonomuraea sp. NPDC050310]|uniref:DinB family protein n=1 Tax=unclassified Nonomuraea TaxID=2593643 RepID=UPI0033CF07D0